ncbi:hypothetical protein EAE99_012130 [Botrytis elliptica]|nr:hypothetical protein EAE99_012130 [Botrytis elliptica]
MWTQLTRFMKRKFSQVGGIGPRSRRNRQEPTGTIVHNGRYSTTRGQASRTTKNLSHQGPRAPIDPHTESKHASTFDFSTLPLSDIDPTHKIPSIDEVMTTFQLGIAVHIMLYEATIFKRFMLDLVAF